MLPVPTKIRLVPDCVEEKVFAYMAGMEAARSPHSKTMGPDQQRSEW